MILSKGQKMIIAIMLAIVVIGGGFLGHSHQVEMQEYITWTIERLVSEDPEEFLANEYGEVDKFTQCKNKKAFQKSLVAYVEEKTKEACANEADPEYRVKAYSDDWDFYSIVHLENMVETLNQLEYPNNEALRDSVYQFCIDTKQANQKSIAAEYEPETDGRYEYEVALDIGSYWGSIEDYNETVGDFYQMPFEKYSSVEELKGYYTKTIELANKAGDVKLFTDAINHAQKSKCGELYSKEELETYYENALNTYYEAGDKKSFAVVLASAQQSPTANQKDYVEDEEIFTWLTKDATNILTTLNGVGKIGYDYAYVVHDKGQSDLYIWISPNAICCDETIIEGDFSEQYAATEKAYKEAHSAAPTDEQAEAETEKVAGE